MVGQQDARRLAAQLLDEFCGRAQRAVRPTSDTRRHASMRP
jgi:hypothetical protein